MNRIEYFIYFYLTRSRFIAIISNYSPTVLFLHVFPFTITWVLLFSFFLVHKKNTKKTHKKKWIVLFPHFFCIHIDTFFSVFAPLKLLSKNFWWFHPLLFWANLEHLVLLPLNSSWACVLLPRLRDLGLNEISSILISGSISNYKNEEILISCFSIDIS